MLTLRLTRRHELGGKMLRRQLEQAQARALSLLQSAGFKLTPEEENRIEVADFGLGKLEEVGLQLLTYLNTERVCAKELVLFPFQTCPEHFHPPVGEDPGKEETFRCRWGDVYLYVPGERTERPRAVVPRGQLDYLTVWHEVHLLAGEQHTLLPGTRHWFQSGKDGAIVSEFSTTSRDELDIFTDPRIVRTAQVQG
jgi:D-lyxose ketol-isomerase